MFNEALDVDGLVMTKLDGSAKGGVLFNIARELKVPIRFIGIGEKVDDLQHALFTLLDANQDDMLEGHEAHDILGDGYFNLMSMVPAAANNLDLIDRQACTLMSLVG